MKHWKRLLINKFLNHSSSLIEPIPLYLTPDINRGVKYSNEFIEMKGKVTLHPEFIDPGE